MCLFFCADPIVREWLHPSVDHGYRKALELKPLLAADLLVADDISDESSVCVSVMIRRVAVSGSMTQRAATLRITPFKGQSWRASSPLRQHPLQALADAWSRLLLWLGWQR